MIGLTRFSVNIVDFGASEDAEDNTEAFRAAIAVASTPYEVVHAICIEWPTALLHFVLLRAINDTRQRSKRNGILQ